MSDLRQRKVGPETDIPATSKSPAIDAERTIKTERTGISLLDILRVIAGLALVSCALSYFVTGTSYTWNLDPWFLQPTRLRAWSVCISRQITLSHTKRTKPTDTHTHAQDGPVRLTDDQLRAYDGTDASKPLYLALNGTIYDVSAGRHAYGPGGSYHFFAGRDATRAFVTGCFSDDLTPDMRGVEEMYVPLEDDSDKALSSSEKKVRRERDVRVARKRVEETVEGWAVMFRGEGGKKYFPVGEVVRPKGWLEKLPKRELCRRAQNLRKPRT